MPATFNDKNGRGEEYSAIQPLLGDGTAERVTSSSGQGGGAGTIHDTAAGVPRNDQDATTTAATSSGQTTSAVLLGCCSLTVVLLGLALVFCIAFLPILIFSIARLELDIACSYWAALVVAVLNLLHLAAIWKSSFYLTFFRFLALPLRRLLLPVVLQIARIESIREREPTLYYQVNSRNNSTGTPNRHDEDNDSGLGLSQFRRSVRRHYRRMEKIYQRQSIRHVSLRADYHLNLSQVVPILWQHEKRICCNSNSSSRSNHLPIVDFIQRALVVTVVPDGILDLYYDKNNNTLVCFQFSICQRDAWHWFMYFCLDDYSKAGIWWHGALLAIQRAHTLQLSYANGQMHQTESKLHAGYNMAQYSEVEILSKLYPLDFTRRIPQEAIDMRLWDG